MADRDLDQNVRADVEFAELGPDFQRKVGEPADVRNRPGPPELADDDLLLGELDKDGNGSRVFVAKGDPIPPAWRHFLGRQLGGRHVSGSRDVVRPLGMASD